MSARRMADKREDEGENEEEEEGKEEESGVGGVEPCREGSVASTEKEVARMTICHKIHGNYNVG